MTLTILFVYLPINAGFLFPICAFTAKTSEIKLPINTPKARCMQITVVSMACQSFKEQLVCFCCFSVELVPLRNVEVEFVHFRRFLELS